MSDDERIQLDTDKPSLMSGPGISPFTIYLVLLDKQV